MLISTVKIRYTAIIVIFICVFICPGVIYGQDQYVDMTDDISRSLVAMGMENVAVIDEPDALYIKFSDNIYRGTFRGLFEALRLFLDDLKVSKDIVVVLQEDKIPYIALELSDTQMDAYYSGSISFAGLMSSVNISYDIDEYEDMFKGIKSRNNSSGKVDLILYPQISLNNSWLDKLYGVIINIAPAVEVGLWKGASITGQVIFPIWNNFTGEMDYIRPGMLVFRQEYRFPKNIFMTFNIGNFNNNRMGTDLSFRYTPLNNRWETGINVGVTGSSTFNNGKWELSTWGRTTGSVFFCYNEPYYNLQFKLSGHRYIYDDYGVRFDCTRHFKEVSIGLYAMISAGETNGGFHFAVPLPGKKRAKRNMIRISAPEYFDWEYGAKTGREFNQIPKWQYYETRPDANHSQRYYNPDFIKDMLVKLAME